MLVKHLGVATAVMELIGTLVPELSEAYWLAVICICEVEEVACDPDLTTSAAAARAAASLRS